MKRLTAAVSRCVPHSTGDRDDGRSRIVNPQVRQTTGHAKRTPYRKMACEAFSGNCSCCIDKKLAPVRAAKVLRRKSSKRIQCGEPISGLPGRGPSCFGGWAFPSDRRYGTGQSRRPLASNKELDGYTEELRQAFRLCLADRPPATQYFRGSSLVAQNWPDILVLQSAFFHKRIQRCIG